MKSEPVVWYIHGAHSSPTSFAYIRKCVPRHDYTDIVYSCDEPVLPVVKHLAEQIQARDRPVYLVGHSLGGVIAVSAARLTSNVAGIVTLASPFGGCKIASLMRWMVPHNLFEDIHPYSTLVGGLQRDPVTVPTLSVVTTAGHSPLIAEPNDSVVSVASQQALRGPVYVTVPLNHFEVLLSDEVVDLISGFIFDE